MNRKKGLIATIVSIIVSLIMLGGVLAFFKVNHITNIDSFVSYFRAATPDVKQCYKNLGKNCVAPSMSSSSSNNNTNNQNNAVLTDSDLNYSGPKVNQPYINNDIKLTKDAMISKLDSLKTAAENTSAKFSFSEKEWPHFLPANNSCWSTQNEILSQQGVSNTIKFLNADRKITTNKNLACSIKSGSWIDAYSGKKINNAILDFIVTPKYANQHGGAKWTSQQKKAFANDVDNFSAVSQKSKDSRNAKDPSDWMPSGKNEQCVFAKSYINVLSKYSLSADNKTKLALSRAVLNCNK